MNLYYDSEFTGLHQQSTLISLAFNADDGQEFYAEFSDYDANQCDDWIKQNVLTHTRWLNDPKASQGNWREDHLTLSYGSREHVTKALISWLQSYPQVDIWADCLAWDWVLFCQSFGGAFGIPQQIFYMPFDLVTLLKAKGLDPDTDCLAFAGLPQGSAGNHRHNALFDARLVRACYKKLVT